MHDIDRTLTEFETAGIGSDTEAFEFESDFEFEDEGAFELESGDFEVEEMEMAAELLDISSEAELDQFLGDLIKKAGRAVGKFAKSSVGRQLGGILKQAARKALPIVGGALGTAIGGPAGGLLGGKLAGMAGNYFGLELEGLTPEDQEFETARGFVKFANEAARIAAKSPANMPPAEAARRAAVVAARKYAPGLLGSSARQHSTRGHGSSGRWIRRGNRIVLLGT